MIKAIGANPGNSAYSTRANQQSFGCEQRGYRRSPLKRTIDYAATGLVAGAIITAGLHGISGGFKRMPASESAKIIATQAAIWAGCMVVLNTVFDWFASIRNR